MLVALHWLLALMIMGLLCLGFFVLANMPNDDPKKLEILVWHMAGGMFVLVLTILRLIIRLSSARPAAARTGSLLLDRLASIAHHSLYLIVFLMIATGWYTGWLISGVFAHKGEVLPSTFRGVPELPGPCGSCNAAGGPDRCPYRGRALPSVRAERRHFPPHLVRSARGRFSRKMVKCFDCTRKIQWMHRKKSTG